LGVIVTKREPFGQGMEWGMHLLQNIIKTGKDNEKELLYTDYHKKRYSVSAVR
jgi:hypothetical protein